MKTLQMPARPVPTRRAGEWAALAFAMGLLLGISVTAGAEAPVYRTEPSGEFLRTWLLCGPFPLPPAPGLNPDRQEWFEVEHLAGFETDFLATHGGEANLRIAKGQVETFQGGSVKWIRHTSDTFDVDLDRAISRTALVAAYGYCEINSPEDRVCTLALGTNDGGRVWLNGERIWDHAGARGLTPDEDHIAVHLRKGRNTLLIKVEERGGSWGFCARFLPFDAADWLAHTPLFRIDVSPDGKAVLHFLHDESVAERVFAAARLTVTPTGQSEPVVWRGAWTRKSDMPLGVPADRYGHYDLRIEGTMPDGAKWTTELPFVAGKRVEHVLFENGKTVYSIVVAAEASESEKWAAEELRHWLKEVSGADFPLRSDTDASNTPEIVVGFNRRARTLLGTPVAPPDDGDESFTYQNVGPTIVIRGGKQRGTMYGVMTFLERELGCRWYTRSVSVAPKKDRYAFEYLHHRESPGIRVRNDFYYEAFDPVWAARNKVNGAMGYREQPGGIECYWAVHTFYRFMPPSEFFEAHPEYYSLLDGKRVHEHAQLCLTHPDVLRIVTDRLKKVMRDNPQYLIYSVSQNDWRDPCACENCRAIVDREGSESGPIIHFVNQVAERIEKEFPDKFVGTLAYSYTRKPCKTLRPRHNVVVRLCSIECCFAHDFHHCPENVSFIEDLRGWSAISPHLYIWDYVVNFSHYIMPYPNFRVLQPNIQAFRDNKAIGIMEQAAYQSRGGEFAELRAYVIAKLLWDPECDVEKVIADFMHGYYGRSGQFVRAYFDRLHGRLTPDTHIHLGMSPQDALFSDAFVREAERLFDQAEVVADSETVRRRVEMARLPIMYLKCRRSPNLARHDGTYDRFRAIVKRESVTHYAEAGRFRTD